jgi:hypothetical protein
MKFTAKDLKAQLERLRPEDLEKEIVVLGEGPGEVFEFREDPLCNWEEGCTLLAKRVEPKKVEGA